MRTSISKTTFKKCRLCQVEPIDMSKEEDDDLPRCRCKIKRESSQLKIMVVCEDPACTYLTSTLSCRAKTGGTDGSVSKSRNRCKPQNTDEQDSDSEYESVFGKPRSKSRNRYKEDIDGEDGSACGRSRSKSKTHSKQQVTDKQNANGEYDSACGQSRSRLKSRCKPQADERDTDSEYDEDCGRSCSKSRNRRKSQGNNDENYCDNERSRSKSRSRTDKQKTDNEDNCNCEQCRRNCPEGSSDESLRSKKRTTKGKRTESASEYERSNPRIFVKNDLYKPKSKEKPCKETHSNKQK